MTSERPEGRLLDQLVAEKVMGWNWMRANAPQVLPPHRWLVPPHEYGDWGHEFPADMTEPTEDFWWLNDEPRHDGQILVPHYSTDLVAAFAVVEHLRANRFTIVIGNPLEASWSVHFTSYMDGRFTHNFVAGESLPDCIVRCALKAIAPSSPVATDTPVVSPLPEETEA